MKDSEGKTKRKGNIIRGGVNRFSFRNLKETEFCQLGSRLGH